ncbi:hypothetical protein ACP70R_000901 [Stipagrostis hirtigluma subsp. patula]
MVAPPANQGAANGKDLRVLLPFSCDSLRIPDDLAEEIGAEKALVVGPSSGKAKAKVRPVEVGRDDDGAFLGRGWPEFADACGVDAGWLLVLRHRGRGVLTVKAFDTSSCLRELGTRPSPADATTSSKDASHRPQFISVLRSNSMEKMLIPAKFVQQYIPKEHLNNHKAIVYGPLGKICPVELEINGSDMFFAGGWSQFLAFHGITKANALLLRYEGNMLFTVKVFETDGCQRESTRKDIRMQLCIKEQQESPDPSFQKHRKNDWSFSDGEMKLKGSLTCLDKASLQRKSGYEIGPPSWIKKKMNTTNIKRTNLPADFCYAIGFWEGEACTVTLKTSLSSTRSWQVRVLPYKNANHKVGAGWRRFCRENGIKKGDICTFNVVETKLWHVVIARR